MKKGAALLISLILISSLGMLALMVVRQMLSGLVSTSRIADSIIADQAAYGGSELILSSTFSVTGVNTAYCPPIAERKDLSNCSTTYSFDQFKAGIKDNPSFGYQIFTEGVSPNRTIYVDVIGAFGTAFKKHRYSIDNAGNIIQEY